MLASSSFESQVLVVGGGSAELFDPAQGAWRAVCGPSRGSKRSGHAAVACRDGRVYVIGGQETGQLPGGAGDFLFASRPLNFLFWWSDVFDELYNCGKSETMQFHNAIPRPRKDTPSALTSSFPLVALQNRPQNRYLQK